MADIRKELNNVKDNPLLDLRNLKDKSLGEGFGEDSATNEAQLPAATAAHRSMIRRFNHHSMMVLKTCQRQERSLGKEKEKEKEKVGQDGEQVNGLKRKHTEQEVNGESEEHGAEKLRKQIQEKIQLDDLQGAEETNAYSAAVKVDLNAERYTHGGQTSSSDANGRLATPTAHLQWCDSVKRELVSNWPLTKHFGAASQGRSHSVSVITPGAAWTAVKDISVGGSLQATQNGEAIYSELNFLKRIASDEKYLIFLCCCL